jgi:hypothetical protein
MTDRLPGSVEGTVPSQWLLDEKVRRQRAEAECERLRADLGAIAHIAANPAKSMNALDGIFGIARAALGGAVDE